MRRLLRLAASAAIEWLNRTEPIQCTGASASWCPVCGDCVCKNPEDSRADDECPLHSRQSMHAETAVSVQNLYTKYDVQHGL